MYFAVISSRPPFEKKRSAIACRSELKKCSRFYEKGAKFYIYMPFRYFQVLLKPGDQGQNRDPDPEVVPEVHEKVEKVDRVQDLAQEVLEVEVDQNPVNRADQVGPEVRAQIPIEITLRVDKRTFCYYYSTVCPGLI
jgi:hypothetical protein